MGSKIKQNLQLPSSEGFFSLAYTQRNPEERGLKTLIPFT